MNEINFSLSLQFFGVLNKTHANATTIEPKL